MTQVLVLSEAEVTALLDLEQLLPALADALVSHSAGRASVPPRVAASAKQGILGAMPVHLAGVALGAKLVSVFPGNHRLGRPSHQALIALFDPADGTLQEHRARLEALEPGLEERVALGLLELVLQVAPRHPELLPVLEALVGHVEQRDHRASAP